MLGNRAVPAMLCSALRCLFSLPLPASAAEKPGASGGVLLTVPRLAIGWPRYTSTSPNTNAAPAPSQSAQRAMSCQSKFPLRCCSRRLRPGFAQAASLLPGFTLSSQNKSSGEITTCGLMCNRKHFLCNDGAAVKSIVQGWTLTAMVKKTESVYVCACGCRCVCY